MDNESNHQWRFWIDVGGTFTDCIYQRPDGSQGDLKVLSSAVVKGRSRQPISENSLECSDLVGPSPGFYEGFQLRVLSEGGKVVARSTVTRFDCVNGRVGFSPTDFSGAQFRFELMSSEAAPLLCIRQAIGLRISDQIPDLELHLGTTRGTNALLTRSGARTGFVTTKGFRQILEIGDQSRPHLFKIDIKKNPPLYEQCIEIDERILFDGTVEVAIDQHRVQEQLAELRANGIESLAICLMHGFRFDRHERQVEEIARSVGFDIISRSSDLAPLVKIVPRGETTSLDAYLNPLLTGYLNGIASKLSLGSQMKLMTSAGSLTSVARFSGKDSTLSGPAGGVVGMARAAQQAGFERSIGFDMGGTSTDVARFDGEFNIEYESVKAGVRVFTPTMSIETVAAGGGSVCRFDGTRLTVGPESAGADPGPACYGRSGPLTVTDVNLYLDRISEQHFPFPLDRSAVNSRLEELCREIERSLGKEYSPATLAAGFFQIANVQMASAIHAVSVAKGFDIRDYVLVGFGGAAGQHLCAVADELEITRALVHPRASVLSAYGISLARQSSHRTRSILAPLNDRPTGLLDGEFAELKADAKAQLVDDGCGSQQIRFHQRIELRFRDTESYLTVEYGKDLTDRFFSEHQQQFGYLLQRDLEIGAIHVEAFTEPPQCFSPQPIARNRKLNTTIDLNGWATVDRKSCRPRDYCCGPARIVDESTSVVVDKDWEAVFLDDGQIVLERQTANQPKSGKLKPSDEQTDPVLLEIFNNRFFTIAHQMGTTLRKTSCSVNVKERLDFSCAVFNSRGELVVNAPHIPVHLGAMSETVKATIQENPEIEREDVFVTNDPYRGGSHLPDITVVTPVFIDRGPLDQSKNDRERPMFFVASRSHHAEIGGKRPGSMPPDAQNLAEEGVLISNFKISQNGETKFDELSQLLSSGPYPSRSVAENLADIAAQIAANQRGVSDLLTLVGNYTAPVVDRYMKLIQQYAESKTRRAIRELPQGPMKFQDELDNGAKILLSVHREDNELVFDFRGTDATCPDSHNANSAIVSAAVMYCLRCLIDEDIPLNEGILVPARIELGDCFLNVRYGGSPQNSPPVSAGNVETSQRIVDTIFGAMGIAAASQGTMNNLLIGDDTFGYYETICGGAGATKDHNGASAVHTHMTNTCLTDPEIVESKLPMIVRQFSIRLGSGGRGLTSGGDGVVREIEVTKPVSVSLLTNRRGENAPFGLEGGEPGMPGRNWLIRCDDAESVELPGQCHFEMNVGDRIKIETPGGGGFGSANSTKLQKR